MRLFLVIDSILLMMNTVYSRDGVDSHSCYSCRGRNRISTIHRGNNDSDCLLFDITCSSSPSLLSLSLLLSILLSMSSLVLSFYLTFFNFPKTISNRRLPLCSRDVITYQRETYFHHITLTLNHRRSALYWLHCSSTLSQRCTH